MNGFLGITNPWTYVLGTTAVILLPGPNSLYVLSVATRLGVRAGYRAAAGVWVGDAVLMALSAGGIASLMQTYPPLFTVVKYAGAVYLAWIGFGLLLGAWRRLRSREATGDPADPAGTQVPAGTRATARADRPFRRALVISLLNPKAILFFVSFFVQFVDGSYPYPAVSFLILAIVAEIISGLYLTALIFSGRYLAAQFGRRSRLAAGLATGVGALFVGFSVRLATASFG